MSDECRKIPVDRRYADLIRAMRRKVEELSRPEAGEPGASVGDLYFVQDVGNSAYCLLRVNDVDCPFWLIHGVTTVGMRTLGELKGDVGIEITATQWDPKLLPVMQLLAARAAARDEHCSCGHRKKSTPLAPGSSLDVGYCPACGASDFGPEDEIPKGFMP
jgi:hypothetical protein